MQSSSNSAVSVVICVCCSWLCPSSYHTHLDLLLWSPHSLIRADILTYMDVPEGTRYIGSGSRLAAINEVHQYSRCGIILIHVLMSSPRLAVLALGSSKFHAVSFPPRSLIYLHSGGVPNHTFSVHFWYCCVLLCISVLYQTCTWYKIPVKYK